MYALDWLVSKFPIKSTRNLFFFQDKVTVIPNDF